MWQKECRSWTAWPWGSPWVWPSLVAWLRLSVFLTLCRSRTAWPWRIPWAWPLRCLTALPSRMVLASHQASGQSRYRSRQMAGRLYPFPSLSLVLTAAQHRRHSTFGAAVQRCSHPVQPGATRGKARPPGCTVPPVDALRATLPVSSGGSLLRWNAEGTELLQLRNSVPLELSLDSAIRAIHRDLASANFRLAWGPLFRSTTWFSARSMTDMGRRSAPRAAARLAQLRSSRACLPEPSPSGPLFLRCHAASSSSKWG
jgi:hypothetical protein